MTAKPAKSVWERLAAMSPVDRARFLADPKLPEVKADVLAALYSSPSRPKVDARDVAIMRYWRSGRSMQGADAI
jgi:hypothetical protein